jgi:hypothetical protein
MAEAPKQKIITWENDQLLCDGEPISIEEAERIVKEQVRDYEDSTAKLVKNDLILNVSNIEALADSVNLLRYEAGMAQIDGRGIEEYKDVANEILKALVICDNALKLFDPKRKKTPRENKPKTRFKPDEWPLNVNNDPEYEPTIDELYEKYHELAFQELIYRQFKNQFFNADIQVEREDIKVFGNLVSEYRLFIDHKDINIYFQINENNGTFGDITGSYVASGLQVGTILLQNTRESFLKYGNNNFKSAQTIENLLVKEIRFLKNTLKQEINYSLSQNISKAEDRLNIAIAYISNFGPLLDKKTKAKLESIIKEAQKAIKEQKYYPVRNNGKRKEKKEAAKAEKTNNKKQTEEEVKKQLLIAFDVSEDKVRFETRQKDEDLLFEALISGQRLTINIQNYKNVLVSSTNTTGTGKTDFQQVETAGNDLIEKIRNAAYLASIPLLTRQIENLSTTIRGSEPKKVFRNFETRLKEIIIIYTDFSMNLAERVQIFLANIYYILDNLSALKKQVIEDLLGIMDKLLMKMTEIINDSTQLVIDNQPVSLTEVKKTLRQVYQSARQENNDILESLMEAKKFVKRIVYSNIIIKELNDYKVMLFEQPDIPKNQKETLRNSAETTIKELADHLSEDMVVGGIARKILGLMHTSISSRDDLFKFNIENIIMEIIKVR